MPGELGQEVLCPTPRGMRHAMHKQDWRGTRIGYGISCYYFQLHDIPFTTLAFHPKRESIRPQDIRLHRDY
jgi:hypothetical protein